MVLTEEGERKLDVGRLKQLRVGGGAYIGYREAEGVEGLYCEGQSGVVALGA